MKDQITYHAVKKAGIRKAGQIQRECLVLNLDGASFYSSSKLSKLSNPENGVVAHVGIATDGKWVFCWEDNLYVRYMRYEMTGKASRYERNQAEREKVLNFNMEMIRRNLTNDPSGYWAQTYPEQAKDPNKLSRKRVGGYVHLWAGDISWGSGKGKMALKPFDGQFRHDWR